MLFLFQAGMDFRFHVKLWGVQLPGKLAKFTMENSHLSWSIPWMFQLAIGELFRSVIIQSQYSATSFILETLMFLGGVIIQSQHSAMNQREEIWNHQNTVLYFKTLDEQKKQVKYQRRKKSKRRIHTFERNPQQKVQRSQGFGRNKYMFTFQGILHI